MRPDEFEKFSETLLAMADMYKKELSSFQLKMYWDDLKEYTWIQFSAAATQIRRSHIYNSFPTIAVFIQIIDPPESREAVAIEALKRYRDLMIYYGSEQSVVLVDDPAMICAINALGGWIEVGTVNRNDFERSQFERDFKKLYSYHSERRTKPVSLKLIGVYERDNRANGYLKADNIDHNGEQWHPIYIEGTRALNQLPDGKYIAPSLQIEQHIQKLIEEKPASIFDSLLIEDSTK